LKVLEKDIRDKRNELESVSKDSQLWKKVVTDFYASAIKFHQEAVMLLGSSQALRDIPITDELHSQIQTVIGDAEKVAKELRDAIAL
jgi:chaperonin cofactor prefoldin